MFTFLNRITLCVFAQGVSIEGIFMFGLMLRSRYTWQYARNSIGFKAYRHCNATRTGLIDVVAIFHFVRLLLHDM